MRIDDTYQMIALGQIKYYDSIYKFGRNEAVGSSEELIAAGGIYGLPPTTDTVTVTSDSPANDNPAGAGARTVHVFGLDGAYMEIDEIVELGGVSGQEFLRVFRAHVETAGNLDPTDGANVGTISIKQSGGTDMVLINPNDGQTLCSCYTVPEDTIALLWSADTTVGEGKTSTNKLKVKEFDSDSPFRTKGVRDNFENSVGIVYKIPRAIPPKSDIVFTAISTAAGTKVSGTFLLQLFKTKG